MELEFHENRFNDSHTLHNGVNELTDWFWRKSVLWKPYFTLFGKGNENLRESNVCPGATSRIFRSSRLQFVPSFERLD